MARHHCSRDCVRHYPDTPEEIAESERQDAKWEKITGAKINIITDKPSLEQILKETLDVLISMDKNNEYEFQLRELRSRLE